MSTLLMPYISRPHLKSFVDRYSDAKWWTFTNKDRIVDGDIMREVSDEDGLCGMYQDEVHEVSGRCVHHAPAPASAHLCSGTGSNGNHLLKGLHDSRSSR